jgi:hypothetical protein
MSAILTGRLGATKSYKWIAKDAEGVVQNLTGFAATFKVTDKADVVADVTKTIGSGIAVTVATGTIIVTLEDHDACMAAVGEYWWSLTITDPAGRVWELDPKAPSKGTLTVTAFGTE